MNRIPNDELESNDRTFDMIPSTHVVTVVVKRSSVPCQQPPSFCLLSSCPPDSLLSGNDPWHSPLGTRLTKEYETLVDLYQTIRRKLDNIKITGSLVSGSLVA